MSTQKLPMVSFSFWAIPRMKAMATEDADRRGHEVVVGEPGHLREIAHGRLTAVRLPVRIRGERHGRVECQRRRHGTKSLRVERQHLLQPLHRVQHE
jgi:hypothetical protein